MVLQGIEQISKMVYQYQKAHSKFILLFIAQQNSCDLNSIMSTNDKRTKRSITTNDKASSAGSKKVFDPELQSFTRRTRFESTTNRDNSKIQKLTVDKLVDNIIYAIDKYYSEDDSGFYNNSREFLAKGIDSWKLKIVDRMNTYEYVELAIAHKPYVQIQVEIVKEWKKNYLLFAIMTYWYNGVQKIKFQSLKHFHKTYDIFCEFVAQISALIFRGWLSPWEKRFNNKEGGAVNKLYEQTSHLIITDSSEFKKVYQKIILPLIEYEAHGRKINLKYDLRQLNAKKCVFDLEKEDNLPKTIQILKKFSKQLKMNKKIELIQQYRSALKEELTSQINKIRQNSSDKKYEVLQKDDFISALVYCIVKGRLQDLRSSLVYMQTLLGENLTLLSKLQLNSFTVDLIAAVDFLCESKIERTCEQLQEEVLRNLPAMQMHNRFVSSPEIPSECQELMVRKHMTEKRITEFESKE